jgi:hypothetical protein
VAPLLNATKDGKDREAFCQAVNVLICTMHKPVISLSQEREALNHFGSSSSISFIETPPPPQGVLHGEEIWFPSFSIFSPFLSWSPSLFLLFLFFFFWFSPFFS